MMRLPKKNSLVQQASHLKNKETNKTFFLLILQREWMNWEKENSSSKDFRLLTFVNDSNIRKTVHAQFLDYCFENLSICNRSCRHYKIGTITTIGLKRMKINDRVECFLEVYSQPSSFTGTKKDHQVCLKEQFDLSMNIWICIAWGSLIQTKIVDFVVETSINQNVI